ncbi:hypothetical protein ABG067_002446 [Albugo candida]|uniref:Homologous recombination OB-fold protein OB-fold domain-containing protein n=1 Tax=Albugo candida TaxID=65357 RepID=A0A024G3K9_9STRA|nr:unnamed protein product [Albugo candida]|eukprot:CCI40874.1 unnamed protein product [Albugo candida]
MTKRSTYDTQNEILKQKYQLSMVKWMRDIPGPLNAIMKADTRAISHGHNDSDSADQDASRITSCFDHGPWVDMCRYINIDAKYGELYGGIKLSKLEHTISGSLESDDASTKIQQLMVLIKSISYTDEEVVARFHDPTGEACGYFHRDSVRLLKPALKVGTGLLLEHVSVLDTSMTKRRLLSTRATHCYLNIMSHNIKRVFASYSDMDGADRSEADLAITQFHESINSSSTSGRVEECNSFQGEVEVLIRSEMVQDTMREISFLSQRQVIQPNPPVRSTTAISQPSKSDKVQWTWTTLTKKPPVLNINDEKHQKKPQIRPIEDIVTPMNPSAENAKRFRISSEIQPSQTDALALLNEELERDDW